MVPLLTLKKKKILGFRKNNKKKNIIHIYFQYNNYYQNFDIQSLSTKKILQIFLSIC